MTSTLSRRTFLKFAGYTGVALGTCRLCASRDAIHRRRA